MDRRLVVRPLAEADIEEAARWYEGEQIGLGSRFLVDLELVLEHTTEAPHQFPLVAAGARRALLRSFPYAVYFRASEHAVVILAVLHLRRNPAVSRYRTRGRG